MVLYILLGYSSFDLYTNFPEITTEQLVKDQCNVSRFLSYMRLVKSTFLAIIILIFFAYAVISFC